MIRPLMLFLLVVASMAPKIALAQAPSPAVAARVETLVSILRDAKADEAVFAPAFLAQVSAAQVEELARKLRETNGTVIGASGVAATGPTEATVTVDYANASATVRIAVEPGPEHRFIGLLVTGVTRRGDSFAAVTDDLKKLHGHTALRVTRVSGETPQVLAALNDDAPMATGSVFKLFVLAALDGEVTAKARRWAEVVPLGPPSLPSGVTQGWPRGMPITLQTLATQMISISDNTATDTLIATIGRPKVDAVRAHYGDTAGALPVLSTLDAFALKMPANDKLRVRWEKGSLGDRRQVLNELEPNVEAIDRTLLAGPPLHIDTVEWPATMGELTGVLGAFREAPVSRSILAVNTALGEDARTRFAYAGYKGGSETGVIAMAWLLQTKSGEWYAVAGAWNDPALPVDNVAFAALMTRAVALVGP